jgi:prepilin-type N-terminal cleavage/methylation domain-containing protein
MFLLSKTRKAFTMLELIMVMVILGIVASISASAIANVYETYISQRAIHDASLKTELAVNQLANRLTYRISGTLLARKPGSLGTVTGTDFFPAQSVPVSQRNTFNALEWIAYDNDTFSATQIPGWSGYCDLNASSLTTLSTPGSTSSNLLQSSHYGAWWKTGLRFMTNNYAVIPAPAAQTFTYNENCLYSDSFRANGCMFPAVKMNNNIFFFSSRHRRKPPTSTPPSLAAGLGGTLVYNEFYQLAQSAFAVVPISKGSINGIPVFDLVLYWGYQPWWGDNYTMGKSSTLIKNVSVFRFKKETSAIRIKICSVEQIGTTDQISICKEKAVIR